jgi:predicted nicotinamide N-methyase
LNRDIVNVSYLEYFVPEVLQSPRGRDVIDLGASVDDPAIYFVLHGARRFIALGPLTNAANCAEETSTLAASLRG